MRLATNEELKVLEQAGKILKEMGYTWMHIQVGGDKDLNLPASSGDPANLAFIAQDTLEFPVGGEGSF